MEKKKNLLASTIVTGTLAMFSSTGSAQVTPDAGAQGSETIRPFQVHVPAEKIADLKRRILATKWPDREVVKDETQGVQFATMQALA